MHLYLGGGFIPHQEEWVCDTSCNQIQANNAIECNIMLSFQKIDVMPQLNNICLGPFASFVSLHLQYSCMFSFQGYAWRPSWCGTHPWIFASSPDWYHHQGQTNVCWGFVNPTPSLHWSTFSCVYTALWYNRHLICAWVTSRIFLGKETFFPPCCGEGGQHNGAIWTPWAFIEVWRASSKWVGHLHPYPQCNYLLAVLPTLWASKKFVHMSHVSCT